MSRTIKTGLDYFPLDTNLDEKFEMIEAEHGLIGFAIIIKLYQEIYKNGYYCLFDKKRKLLFCKQNNVDINDLNVIIKSALEWDMFTKKIYNDYNILTSAGIQKQFLKITERRKEVTINEKTWLIDNNKINENIIVIDDNILPINTSTGTQSKGKGESKVKKSDIKDKDKLKSIVTEFYKYQKSQFSNLVSFDDKKIDEGVLIIDKLIRIDGFNIEGVTEVLKFIVKDDFWAKQVLSLNGLRKKGENGNTKFVNAAVKSRSSSSSVNAHNKALLDEIIRKEQKNEVV